MKKTFYALAAAILSLISFLSAVYGDTITPTTERKWGAKDECMLVASNCPSPDYRLQERIERLRNEIDKGTTVYTQNELRILRRKLDDARATQDFFERQAPSIPPY